MLIRKQRDVIHRHIPSRLLYIDAISDGDVCGISVPVPAVRVKGDVVV